MHACMPWGRYGPTAQLWPSPLAPRRLRLQMSSSSLPGSCRSRLVLLARGPCTCSTPRARSTCATSRCCPAVGEAKLLFAAGTSARSARRRSRSSRTLRRATAAAVVGHGLLGCRSRTAVVPWRGMRRSARFRARDAASLKGCSMRAPGAARWPRVPQWSRHWLGRRPVRRVRPPQSAPGRWSLSRQLRRGQAWRTSPTSRRLPTLRARRPWLLALRRGCRLHRRLMGPLALRKPAASLKGRSR